MSQNYLIKLGSSEPGKVREAADNYGIASTEIESLSAIFQLKRLFRDGLLRGRPDRLILPVVKPERARGFGLLFVWTLLVRPRNVVIPVASGHSTWKETTLVKFLWNGMPGALIQLIGSVVTVTGHIVCSLLLAPFMRVRPMPERVSDVDYIFTMPGYPLRVGGLATHTLGVMEGLRRIGIRVTLVQAVLESSDSPFGEVINAGVSRLSRLLPGLVAMGGDLNILVHSRLTKLNTDLVYQRQTPCSVGALLVATVRRKPYVLEYNSTVEQEVEGHWVMRTYARMCEALNLRYASRVLAISQVLVETLVKRGVNPERIQLCPNGVDPRRFRNRGAKVRTELGVNDEVVLFGFVGSFGFWHGAPVLAEAFCRVVTDHPEAKLLLVGDGSELPQVQAMLNEKRVSEKVIVTHRVEADEVPGLLEACDILCSPHVPWPDGGKFHGSPTKLFEYMAAGRAILASDLGQIGEVLENEATALLITPGDVDALVEGMERLLEDTELRKQLGKAAAEKARLEHTWEHNAKRIVGKA